MASNTQQPTPLPIRSNLMSPMPMPHPHAKKPAQPDMFLDMIQGPAIPVIVGSGPSVKHYTLPVALVCMHSNWFRFEMIRLNAPSREANQVNKKRKLSPTEEAPVLKTESSDSERDSDDEVTAKVDRQPDAVQTPGVAKKQEIAIRLPDVDPAIFGLFLKFIYKDAYPESADAKATSVSAPKAAVLPANPSARHFAHTTDHITGRKTDMPSLLPTPPSTPIRATPMAMPSLLPMPPPTPIRATPMAPPPAPITQAHLDTIPPSIHAWLLAQRLGALSFMNHCTTRIYHAIGTHFALTPSLMNHVWSETSVTQSPATVLHPSPLRKLLMGVLVTYWSHPNPANPNGIIMRSLALSPHFSTPLKLAWDNLFDTHKDLRENFIHGLQGGVQMLPVHGYYAMNRVPADKAVKEMSNGKSGGRADAVVVKKEKEGDDEIVEVVGVAGKEKKKKPEA